MMQYPFALLLGLKQITIVEDLRVKFELYAGPLRGTDPEYLKGIFLNGLREELKAVKLHPVRTLGTMPK